MCHHYRIAEEEPLFETAEEPEDEPEPELAREEERERPIPTADD